MKKFKGSYPSWIQSSVLVDELCSLKKKSNFSYSKTIIIQRMYYKEIKSELLMFFSIQKRLVGAIVTIMLLGQGSAIAQKAPSNTSTAELKKMMQDALKKNGVGKNSSFSKGVQQAIDRAANGERGRKLPIRDVKRIAGLSNRILSYTELCDYIKQVHAAVEKELKPNNLPELNAFYNKLKADTVHPNTTTNAASGCMMMGDVGMALWLMGKASIDNPINTNTLNNYAAFLIMNGGEHLAMPILKRLNYVYPKNVTVLNNLGQAWFGLGDFDKAKKYLDTVQMIYPAHSQAANTQSYIAESKGDKQGAIKQAKQSISSVYSREKQQHIEDLGGKINDEDIHWSLHVPEDALGIDKLLKERPEFYNNRDEFISLHPEWVSFIASCGTLLQKLQEEAAEGMQDAMMKVPSTPVSNGKIIVPAFWVNKAQAKLDAEAEDYNNHAMKLLEKRQEFQAKILQYFQTVVQETQEITERYDKLLEKATGKEYGELIRRRDNEICKREKLFVERSFAINSEMRELYLDFSNREKRFRKFSIYYKKFIAPTEAMYTKWQQMDLIGFLAMIAGLAPIGSDPAFMSVGDVEILGKDFSDCTPPKLKLGIIKELPDFDIVNCKSESSFVIPRIGSITLQCNIMITELDADFFPIHGSYKENWVKGEFIEGTIGIGGEVGFVEVGVDLNFNDKGFKDGKVKVEHEIEIFKGVQGPMQVGVKGVVGVEFGFDTKGIEDVTLSGDIKGSVNMSGGDKEDTLGKELNVKTGATASTTWNAGGFSDGKANLKSVSVAGFK